MLLTIAWSLQLHLTNSLCQTKSELYQLWEIQRFGCKLWPGHSWKASSSVSVCVASSETASWWSNKLPNLHRFAVACHVCANQHYGQSHRPCHDNGFCCLQNNPKFISFNLHWAKKTDRMWSQFQIVTTSLKATLPALLCTLICQQLRLRAWDDKKIQSLHRILTPKWYQVIHWCNQVSVRQSSHNDN